MQKLLEEYPPHFSTHKHKRHNKAHRKRDYFFHKDTPCINLCRGVLQYYESAVNIVLCDFGKIVCGFALILFENSLYFFENIGNHINELVGCTFFPVNGNKPYIALINGKKCNRLNCHTCTAAAAKAVFVFLLVGRSEPPAAKP